MADQLTLMEALDQRGPYAVWDLMTEDEQKALGRAVRAIAPGAAIRVTVMRAGAKKTLRARMPK